MMNRNPVFKRLDVGEPSTAPCRHVLCPRYDTCLDEAVAMEQNFECSACPYKQRDIREYVIHDGRGNELRKK